MLAFGYLDILLKLKEVWTSTYVFLVQTFFFYWRHCIVCSRLWCKRSYRLNLCLGLEEKKRVWLLKNNRKNQDRLHTKTLFMHQKHRCSLEMFIFHLEKTQTGVLWHVLQGGDTLQVFVSAWKCQILQGKGSQHTEFEKQLSAWHLLWLAHRVSPVHQ